MSLKILDKVGLEYLWTKLKAYFAPTSHTHGNITSDGKLGTASRVVVTDENKAISVSSVTTTELGYLSGVTSAVQTQLNAKADDSAVVHVAGTESISGAKVFASNTAFGGDIVSTADSSSIALRGGTASDTGACAFLYGSAHASRAGWFRIFARTSSSVSKLLEGRPDGTLTWGGQAIQTSSDERLKTPLAAVPDAVLDAWEAVGWGQFQYLDAVERKGESARLHLGLVAQRVEAAFEARGLDACAYGILCFDRESGMWTVRYAEALAMEAACQRRRADRLEARVAALEAKLR